MRIVHQVVLVTLMQTFRKLMIGDQVVIVQIQGAPDLLVVSSLLISRVRRVNVSCMRSLGVKYTLDI